jgi:predicted enzyme related to lactoylglutathione lyase
MTEHDTPWAPGTPCWMDLASTDHGSARAFYAGLFGWEFEDTGEDFGHYLIARKDGHRTAGVGSPPEGQETPAAWTTYLASVDADATSAAVTAAGGTVLFPPMDIGDEGRMFLAMDPGGAAFGVWQAKNHTGSQLANEPGAFAWNECMSRDFAAAKAFYAQVFGYGWQDMSGDGFTYAAMTVDDRAVGGLGEVPSDLPPEVPSHWMGYFQVDDADAAAAKVLELGGTVQREPWDTPFGKMAMVSDGQGAAFSIMAATSAPAS